MRGFILGIISALFFSLTFILNEVISSTQGNFLWTASLRYIFMLIILFIILLTKKQVSEVYKHILEFPKEWIFWSTIGFGFFYLPLCFASTYGEGWLVASTWQITIVAGAFAYPLGNRKMMNLVRERLTALQRVFGMPLSSLPFWIIVSIYGFFQADIQNITKF